MTDDDILKRQPRYGQKGKPIAVVDKVKTRYGNTSDYCVNVPLASVHALGADGGYADDCSTLELVVS